MDELRCTWEGVWDLIPEWVGVHRQTVNLRGNRIWEASYTWKYKQKGCVCAVDRRLSWLRAKWEVYGKMRSLRGGVKSMEP